MGESKNNKSRKITKFICQEMLYDYVTDSLPEARKKDVEKCLQEFEENKKQLQQLEKTIDYCESLSKTEISEPFYIEIKESKAGWSKFRDQLSWNQWPEFLRWGVEALAVSLVVAAIAIIIPWGEVADLLPQQQIVQQKVVSIESKKDLVSVPAQPVTESKPQTKQAPPAPRPVVTPPEKEKSKPAKVAPIKKVKLVASKKVKGATKGEVFRGFMKLSDIQKVTPEITALIESLGGEKAGRVKLGWQKKKGSYYHLKISGDNYEALINGLKNFGPVRIYKDPHWRVMPEGQIRIILWVEDSEFK